MSDLTPEEKTTLMQIQAMTNSLSPKALGDLLCGITKNLLSELDGSATKVTADGITVAVAVGPSAAILERYYDDMRAAVLQQVRESATPRMGDRVEITEGSWVGMRGSFKGAIGKHICLVRMNNGKEIMVAIKAIKKVQP